MDRFTGLLAIPSKLSRQQLIENAIRGGIALSMESEEASDSDRLVDFLREHLRKNRGFLRSVDTWFTGLWEYAQLCADIGAPVANRSATSSGLQIVEESTNSVGLYVAFVTRLCRVAVESKESPVLKAQLKELRVVESQLRIGGTVV